MSLLALQADEGASPLGPAGDRRATVILGLSDAVLAPHRKVARTEVAAELGPAAVRIPGGGASEVPDVTATPLLRADSRRCARCGSSRIALGHTLHGEPALRGRGLELGDARALFEFLRLGLGVRSSEIDLDDLPLGLAELLDHHRKLLSKVILACRIAPRRFQFDFQPANSLKRIGEVVARGDKLALLSNPGAPRKGKQRYEATHDGHGTPSMIRRSGRAGASEPAHDHPYRCAIVAHPGAGANSSRPLSTPKSVHVLTGSPSSTTASRERASCPRRREGVTCASRRRAHAPVDGSTGAPSWAATPTGSLVRREPMRAREAPS